MDNENNTLVSDVQTEHYVIGTLLNRERYVADAMGSLSEDSFTDNKCRECWRIIVQLAKEGKTVDILSVTKAALETRGAILTALDVTDLSNRCVVGDNLYDHIETLRELTVRRKSAIVGLQIQNLSKDRCTPVDEVLNKSRELIDTITGSGKEQARMLKETLAEVRRDLHDRMNGNGPTGVLTGFHQIDEKGGFHYSDLIIVAAETSVGKTSFALAVTLNAIQAGYKVAFYSLEMTGKQLTSRILSMKSGVNASVLSFGTPTQYDLDKIKLASSSLNGDKLFFDDRSTSNLENIIGSIRRMKAKHDISGAILDYVQILSVNTRVANKEQQMADVARRLKNLAKELNIWIVALSQLSRDRENPEPALSRLRDSGQIAEAADMVILLYRPELYGRKFPKPFQDKETHNAALVDIAKGRNTGIFKFVCGFIPETTLFYDCDLPQLQNDEPF